VSVLPPNAPGVQAFSALSCYEKAFFRYSLAAGDNSSSLSYQARQDALVGFVVCSPLRVSKRTFWHSGNQAGNPRAWALGVGVSWCSVCRSAHP